jgi:hypothetical protein
MSAYPEGFHAWPTDERDAFFAAEMRAYDERKKAEGKNHPALRLAATTSEDFDERSAPPIDHEPNGHDGAHEPDVGTADEPLPKLVLLKRVKGRVREWNVREWIPKRTPTLFQGDGGLGKSTILQQW